MKSFFYSLWEVLEIVLIAVITVFIVRNFLIQPFLVDGTSMEPNFSSGDYLLIDEISYRFREPRRGEVIVFHYPGNESTYYIKRIIGLPNEKLIMNEGKITVFNEEYPEGFVINENYLPSYIETSGDRDFVLDDDEYFVMGDNRKYSFDSRSWGNLQEKEIVGLARLRLWPFNKAMAIEKPAY
ncbi:signal peptidase I [Candidatus Wolfebacteria bacterium]|nr:signal peptidase I [Candidatus Wolfebacteria bacterium]